jgi:MipA family protein
MSKVGRVLGASMLVLFLVRSSHGAEPASVESPGWLIGAGYVSAPNPFGSGVDSNSTPIPLVGYIGERLTWLGPYLRYDVVTDSAVNLAAVIETRFEGIPEDVNQGPLAGIHARKPAIEAGADVSYGRFIASIRTDVSGRHDGYEFALAVQERRRLGETWLLEGRIGAAWQSAELTSHLYGVDATETGSGLDLYEPGGALNYEASLFASYQISRRWMALGSVAVRRLDDDIRASPIVDQEYEFGGFAGFAYQLGHR